MHSSNYLTLDGDVRQMRQADIDALSGRISGGLLGRGDKGYDDARKVWNATVDHRPALIARCMNDADVQAAVRFAAAAADAAQRSRRRPSHRRQCGGRGRPDDRPLGLAHGQRRRREADRAGRARRAAFRLRPRSAGARPGDAARHQLDHRRRRPHPRRRLRLADAQPRPDDRQPARRHARHRRRHAAPGVGDVGAGAVLGPARRRRQLRRRHLVRVPAPSGRPRSLGRARRLSRRAGAPGAARLARLQRHGARGAERLDGAAQGAAPALHSRRSITAATS